VVAGAHAGVAAELCRRACWAEGGQRHTDTNTADQSFRVLGLVFRVQGYQEKSEDCPLFYYL
jgi:hypothetical protein